MSDTLTYGLAAFVLVCFIGARTFEWLAHREWKREGEALTREFDVLWSYRARVLDRKVHRWQTLDVEQQERVRDQVLAWFERVEDHGLRRAQWAARAP